MNKAYDSVLCLSPRSRPQLAPSFFVLFFLFACGELSIFLFRSPSNASNSPHPRVLNPHASRKPCGTTLTEARQRGCQFDIALFCWLSEACWDAELSQNFDSYTQWTWWLDEMPLGPSALSSLLWESMQTSSYRESIICGIARLCGGKCIGHCFVEVWEAIDNYVGSYNHTHHCERCS